MTRHLSLPPSTVIDPTSGAPRTGSFRGALPQVDLEPLGRSALYRLLHGKRWIYTAVASAEVFVGLAIVDVGYAGNAFAFAWEPGKRDFVAERSMLGPPGACRLVDEPHAVTVQMRTAQGECEARLVRGKALVVHARLPGFVLDAALDLATPRPALSAIGVVPGGVVDATEKHALLEVRGDLRAGGRSFPLDGAVGGYDYTHGLLARHTRWRWGFLLGRAKTGERVAANLVQGFLGERECGVWVDDELFPVGEGRFVFEAHRLSEPWRVRSADGALDLRFHPSVVHAEARNLLLVRSRFVQPVGRYEGRIVVGGRELELESAYGVAEDQNVVW